MTGFLFSPLFIICVIIVLGVCFWLLMKDKELTQKKEGGVCDGLWLLWW